MNDNFFNIALLMLFIAAFFAIEGVYIWWNSRRGPEATRLAKRLRMISAGGGTDPAELALLKRRLTSNSPAFDRVMQLVPRIETLDRFLVQSGTDWTLPNFATYTASLFGMGLFGALLAGQPVLIALAAGTALAVQPLLYLSYRRQQRIKRFEILLPETLDLIGRSLRAGHAFPSALQMAGAEMPDPAGEEFRQTFDEINYGISAQDALQNLARRMPSTDLGFFIIAVLIQRETGGNLSEILTNIGTIIRERLKLFGKVKALSAEGRFSGLVLIFLPMFTGLLLYAIDRDFMSLLWTDPNGLMFLKGGAFFMVVGALWMRKIVRIHF